MAYTFKYQLQEKPLPSVNGSGAIGFLINGVCSTDGVNFSAIPSYSKISFVHVSLIKSIMDMPDGTAQQKSAKNNALKEAIKSGVYDIYSDQPKLNWSIAGMEKFVTNNDSAAAEVERLDDYLINTLGQVYPVNFNP